MIFSSATATTTVSSDVCTVSEFTHFLAIFDGKGFARSREVPVYVLCG
jgi:hypothetical protein